MSQADTPSGERIAKVLARAGVCSRREAERLIVAGRVSVDGKKITSPALNVGPDTAISVDGEPVRAPEPTRLWRHHKRRERITSNRDPEGRPTVFDDLPNELGRLISVGRLDYTSEGLLLLTNDGELARFLELPSTGWTRRYRVRVHGYVDDKKLAPLASGLTVDGVRYEPVKARLDKQQGSNAWLTMALKEGKNREIRKLCAHLGFEVTRLIRVGYGPFQLGDLQPGDTAAVQGKLLKDQLGAHAKKFRLPHHADHRREA